MCPSPRPPGSLSAGTRSAPSAHLEVGIPPLPVAPLTPQLGEPSLSRPPSLPPRSPLGRGDGARGMCRPPAPTWLLLSAGRFLSRILRLLLSSRLVPWSLRAISSGAKGVALATLRGSPCSISRSLGPDPAAAAILPARTRTHSSHAARGGGGGGGSPGGLRRGSLDGSSSVRSLARSAGSRQAGTTLRAGSSSGERRGSAGHKGRKRKSRLPPLSPPPPRPLKVHHSPSAAS